MYWVGWRAVKEDILRQQLTSTCVCTCVQTTHVHLHTQTTCNTKAKRLARRLGRRVRSSSLLRWKSTQRLFEMAQDREKTDTSISRQWTARTQQGQPPSQSSCDWSYQISLNMLIKQWGPSSSQESSNGPFQRHQNELRFPQEALSCCCFFSPQF